MKATVSLLYAYSKLTLRETQRGNEGKNKDRSPIWLQLIMQPRLSQRSSRIESLIKYVP